VTLTADKATKVDFKLEPRTPSFEDATASEIIAALPGTDAQKHFVHPVRQLPHVAVGAAEPQDEGTVGADHHAHGRSTKR